jgi:DNA-binding NarL/FixJ family response regulator
MNAQLHPSPASAPAPTPASAPQKSWRLLIVDDHPVYRHGISQFLSEQDGLTICGEAENAHSALEAMRRHHPDLVLLDVSMPGTNGIELTKIMLAEQPKLLILVFSMHDDSLYALRALRAGAKGYVMKQNAMECILDALRQVMGGGLYVSPQFGEKLIFKAIQGSNGDLGLPVDKLSDRELEVFQLLGRQKSTREIAEDLHLSVKTIETHRAHIKEKLGFKSSEEMTSFAVDWATVSDDGHGAPPSAAA